MTQIPLTLREANAHVLKFHRHNKPCVGHRFSIGLMEGNQLVGVAICGRPIARQADNPGSLEILRLCVAPDAPRNACSFLYRVCYRVWMAMGGKEVITYTLQSESGSSLRGAGFQEVLKFDGASWSRENRPRETQAVQLESKVKWRLAA